MAEPRIDDVPAKRLEAGDFAASIGANDLVLFVLNVGDGDTQLLLLPEEGGSRRAIVVDVYRDKVEDLLDALREGELLEQDPQEKALALVVATHPHADHIKMMARFLERQKEHIGAFWEPGYYMATPTYFRMMDTIAELDVPHSQPTSGSTRFIDQVKVTVLAPGIGLKNRYDSYGIDINDSSIALRVDFPARRYYKRDKDRAYTRLPKGASLILGADAQTASWSQVMVDFPQLGKDKTAAATALRKAGGVSPLRADVFKVPHHGSKHGLNLELVEAIDPKVSLVSSVREGGKYNFPHSVSLEALREGVEATAQSGKEHSADYELGIHCTSGRDSDDERLGSIAVVLSPSGSKRTVWRFGDDSDEPLKLDAARRFD